MTCANCGVEIRGEGYCDSCIRRFVTPNIPKMDGFRLVGCKSYYGDLLLTPNMDDCNLIRYAAIGWWTEMLHAMENLKQTRKPLSDQETLNLKIQNIISIIRQWRDW